MRQSRPSDGESALDQRIESRRPRRMAQPRPLVRIACDARRRDRPRRAACAPRPGNRSSMPGIGAMSRIQPSAESTRARRRSASERGVHVGASPASRLAQSDSNRPPARGNVLRRPTPLLARRQSRRAHAAARRASDGRLLREPASQRHLTAPRSGAPPARYQSARYGGM